MTDDILTACRDLRLLTSFWFFACIAAGIVAVHFGCLYAFGVRLRLPRMRSTMRRLAGERDSARARAERLAVDVGAMRAKAEKVAQEAQKEIDAAKAAAAREREIRKRTEERLVDVKDQVETLEGFLAAVNAHHAAPAETSWVDQAAFAEAGALTK